MIFAAPNLGIIVNALDPEVITWTSGASFVAKTPEPPATTNQQPCCCSTQLNSAELKASFFATDTATTRLDPNRNK